MEVLVWWLAVQLIAVIALPLSMKVLRFLPDGGGSFARPVGLLLISYTFWLLGVLGFLQNNTACLVAVLLGLALASALLWRREREEMLDLLRRQRRHYLISEALFFAALVGFALFRAYNPEIAYTEKPMEFGFLNAALRSETFPPSDPWLSGYAISYYYLGYVIAAVLTRLSALPSAVSFNLTNATLFALTLSGAYSLVWNMAEAHNQRTGRAVRGPAGPVLAGLLGGFLVAMVGNLEGVFEIIRAHGWGSEALWNWLDVRNLGPTAPSATWYPDDPWWWWRASRVIHDRDLLGGSAEVISEFPFFSFLLGDNHPHVLALPFVLLALALALNVLLSSARSEHMVACEPPNAFARLMLREGGWQGWRWDIPLWGLLLGALGFLNTWDYPIYLGIMLLAYAARSVPPEGGGTSARGRSRLLWAVDVISMGLVLVGLGLVLYLPFYLGLRSQAGGIGLVLPKTKPQQYLLMFGIQVIFVAGLALAVVWRMRSRPWRVSPLGWVLSGALLVLAALTLVLGWWTAGGVSLAAGIVVLLLSRAVKEAQSVGCKVAGESGTSSALSVSVVLALIMVLAGFLLTLVVEFVYLRDVFNSRMNTVFKFYYQAWVLLSLAGAFGAYYIAESWKDALPLTKAAIIVWASLAAVTLLAGSTYTVAATVSKANGFSGEPTLDGTRYVQRSRPWEQEGIEFLEANAPPGAVMLEAAGDSYTEYNWISAATGIPTVLGWAGHELQWRGSYEEPARREADISAVYRGTDARAIATVLEEYGVEYVVVGPKERSKYRVSAGTMRVLDSLLIRVFENDQMVIYGRRG